MKNIAKQAGMDRREFLQLSAGGLLLSMAGTQTLSGATAQEIVFAADGFSLTIQVPRGGAAHLRSLRNPKTGFEWVRPESPLDPVFALASKPSR